MPAPASTNTMDIGSITLLIRTHLWAQILLAMVLGLSTGLLLSPHGAALLTDNTSALAADWLALPGAVFLNLIQMMVIPLVLSSIVLGLCSSGDSGYLKQVGMRILPYFVTTTTIAVSIGIVLTLTLRPGDHIDASLVQHASAAASRMSDPQLMPSLSLPERIAQLIPTNINQAMVTKDMLQIVIYAIILGVAITALPLTMTAPLTALLQSVQEVSLKVVGWAMMLAPYAVFGLLAELAIRLGPDAILGMSAYVGVVLLGLLLLLSVYLLMVAVLAHRSPLWFLRQVRQVQLLAFSTSSSAAVMPLSMKTAQDSLQVSPGIARFVVPLGATVNMDGTALYQVVAALFLTQVYGIELSQGQILMLTITTVGASIGSPSTPGVGIVILATILHGIGVPAQGIALLIGVDRLLDMCRTAINVSGDLTACLIMERWLGHRLSPQPPASADAQASAP
ncbi:dicarboxylate/amino acid:cation symporter [Ferrimonas sp. SCSIO 43195]|uniref:dicarboxylate/amino acid:cation symporter n=1 Tax=Ferrimonas sp. SCSIO 43195 TaxID=2822844 RepID=UPI002075BFBF|nr:dicarboxylate/amino acid:cation symporter [Ferrimonas sp. SCSIO 43195]